MNTSPEPDPVEVVQSLMEELESSRQSRLRAWEALQKFRATLSDLAGIAIQDLKKALGQANELLQP